MNNIKLAVGCFAGVCASAIGFGITYDWLKTKTRKSKSGVNDIPEPESGEVPLDEEE